MNYRQAKKRRSFPNSYIRMFYRLLKKEHISWHGWELAGIPYEDYRLVIYVFYDQRKHKEIKMYYWDKDPESYEINVYDPKTCFDIHMDTMRQALSSPFQKPTYSYRYLVGTTQERKAKRIIRKIYRYKRREKTLM